jgi:hypothetical protein
MTDIKITISIPGAVAVTGAGVSDTSGPPPMPREELQATTGAETAAAEVPSPLDEMVALTGEVQADGPPPLPFEDLQATETPEGEAPQPKKKK